MLENTVLILLACIVFLEFIVELVLENLNAKSSNSTVPDVLTDVFAEKEYITAIAYNKKKTKVSMFSSTFNVVLILSFLFSGIPKYLHVQLSLYIDTPIVLSLLYFAIVFLVSDFLNLPFQLYNTFVVEQKFGFNKMKLQTFVVDKVKVYALTLIFGGGIMYVLLILIEHLNSGFWLWFWLFIMGVMFLVNMFYASVILPLFNKLIPLEEGELKTAIQKYCIKIGFPLTKIYVINGSKRSTKANAFFSGVGANKKIVLYDTLIKNHSTEELVAVLAHEVGHYKKKHILSGYISSMFQIGLMLFLLSKVVFNPIFSEAFGVTGYTIHLNLIVFAILYTPVSKLTEVLSNYISRKNEYEADEFAALTHQKEYLILALKKLNKDHLSNLTPHKGYVMMHYSHPTLLQRVTALKKITYNSK